MTVETLEFVPYFFDTPVIVDVGLIDGTMKTGRLSEFDPTSKEIRLAVFFLDSKNRTQSIPLRLNVQEVGFVAFHEPVIQPNEGWDQFREFDVRLVMDRTFTVMVRPEQVSNAFGFFGYPVSRQSVPKIFFFFNHAIHIREDKEPLGSWLVKEGFTDAESVDRGLAYQAQTRSPPIGQILVEQSVIRSEDAERAAEQQAALAKQGRPMRLGEILVQAGLATDDDIGRALMEQKRRKGKRLGEVLVELGIVKEIDVAKTLARKFQLQFVNLDDETLTDEALAEIPARLVEKYRVFPFKSTPSEICIAISDPLAMEPLDMLRFSVKKRIVEVMVVPSQLERYINTYFNPIDAVMPDVAMDDLMAELNANTDADREAASDFIEARFDDSVVAKLVNQIIVEAYRRNASDIHIEPYGSTSQTVVRFRIDGVCGEFQKIPVANRKQVVARIKIMANLDITERRLPQDGKIRFRIGKRTVELRVATIPTVNDNEDVVLRILAGGGPMPLGDMGFHPYNLDHLEHLVKRPYGMLLAVGPTGSGKTTTLHALVGHINDAERKIWTAEDPVEITQYGLRQVQVKAQIGLTFAAAMRSFLRADPDVILVGEMRDHETAAIGVEASLTGHLVLSTLHTNSAAETVTRLIDMGIDPFSFADALLGVLAQRLARRLCKECQESYTASKDELAQLESLLGREKLRKRTKGEPLTLWRSPGCEHCGYKGYKGRLGIHELLVVDEDIRAVIQKKATVDELLSLAREKGMRTLLEDGLDKAIAGHTDVQKVLAVCSR